MRVKLDNIGKKYEGRENFTIRNIDLDIEDKDFCVILGPSGCGKSTLIRMIAGLNSITEGTLYFDDKIMNKVEPKDRDIAMVFQSYALYPHMTVYENMAFSLNMKNESKKLIDERVKNAAKILQLEDYLYNRPSDISGGQRQRVALGRAIVRNPAVFLMDEPLSNLDAKLRESMRVEIVRLHNQLNTTSIYVTHDQTEAMTMATKIVLLDKGIVQQVGAPTDFYRKPNNLFVAGFIGSPTMNIIEGKITDGIFVSNTGEIKIRPSDNDSKLIRNYEGKKVYLGIRSERFIAEKRDYNTLSASIDVIEMLGKEQLLYTKLNDGTNIVISQPGYFDYNIGEKHYFTLDPEALHFFDGDTTERIN
ncbi:ABC transporter ATP-binding protein [Anaerococcus sp.]|jgi:ABC transporter related|uniref:ABC transporter ATP-binding protein n=1 Tax=Anaerococcus sp. TaxID=1872515 RepID=UPI00258457E9|nr:sn-glycerol-3-phosphate ABC transporter ATP-binding protein UgpC [Anaerococcus sp.]MDU1828911.1 sn-glycerol-3-phosphate ABC transporter ATP-binding protein UgpC [Anaerococcus sp.]MDU1864996.1 sn-glycerol-3-phosphate ABC transporter ATP-binding protein UgpC [Anaerococcus sp.]MDU3211648.1 sn-glycerol-3-phosphate ABC transporter ATP-binding protein UgpC [Anaerococcus sp.]